MDNHLRFRLDLSYDDYLAYYQGVARAVRVRSLDGRVVEFPASALRSFVTHDGVHGVFELTFDAAHKFISLIKAEG